ncbi:CCDC34 [Mytilus coruscus]|uniref:CCDC34 n=1 Tax=Mytilus coruscus TaxID=42192 RepID=A0A6J8BA86_MYTCO|nr:CCDC34 [Mytilus coruscus]
MIKLQGLQWKASPSVLPLIKTAKTKHKEWVDKGKPNDISKTSKIKAQRELRKQMRKEKYEDRQKIYSEIMDNPSMKKFYQLINRNRGQSKTSTTSIIKGPDCDISDPKNQTKRFSQYMEDLFVTKDNSYENTFLELSTVRTNAIDLIYENMNTELEPLSETEIFEAIGKLNTGKAMDEFGISSEHFKTARNDIALLSDDVEELQIMLNTVVRNAKQDRVIIHPTKTNAVILNKDKTVRKNLQWNLGTTCITPTNQTKHLGIIRAEIKENNVNVEDSLSLARRTLYSLINSGLHGSNDLNPITSYQIYRSYVIPKLLFGLEILPLQQIDIDRLRKFHINCLRKFQSLSQRTALCAVYLLIGALPIEAELHKRQLSFLYSLLNNENESIQQLNQRQISINIKFL